MANWELRIRRLSEQVRGDSMRTVGTYAVWHDGALFDGHLLSGTTAEARGPSSNGAKAIELQRIEAGSYPLFTTDGPEYLTFGYRPDNEIKAAMPGLELRQTGARSDILIHPGKNVFLSSIGCINVCTSLSDADENIDYKGSRLRVIALIEDLQTFFGEAFPASAPKRIAGASVVIDEDHLQT